jgi:hypothetical protein
VIENRLAGFKSLEEINSLHGVGHDDRPRPRDDRAVARSRRRPVKADDSKAGSKARSRRPCASLKDRQELFAGGENVIRSASIASTSTPSRSISRSSRDGVQHVHITGTKYFEPITDEAFLATRDVWDQEMVSETATSIAPNISPGRCSRSEDGGLKAAAGQCGRNARTRPRACRSSWARVMSKAIPRASTISMARRFSHALLTTTRELQLARFSPDGPRLRAGLLESLLSGRNAHALGLQTQRFAQRNRLFPGDPVAAEYITALARFDRTTSLKQTKLYPTEIANEAGEYLFHELITGEPPPSVRKRINWSPRSTAIW